MPTQITTSAFAQPTTRVGARPFVRLTNGNLLFLAHTGTALVSREGATLAALVAATPAQIAASTGTADATNPTLLGQAEFFGSTSNGSTPTRSSYASGAWTAQTVGAGIPNASASNGFMVTAGGVDYYHTVTAGNDTASMSEAIHAGLTGAQTISSQPGMAGGMQYGGANCVSAFAWNTLLGTVAIDKTLNLMWSATKPLNSATTTDYPAAVLIEALPVGSATSNNLAAVNDRGDGGSTDTVYIAYHDTTGIVVRALAAATDATMTGHSWSAKVSATTQATDRHPALFRDDATNSVYLYWIDGGAANAVKRAKLTISGGVVTVGTVATVISTTATRNYLTSIANDTGTATLAWAEGTANPYAVMATQDSVAVPVAPTDFTLSPASASGLPSVASGTFTVSASGTPSASVAVALSDGGAGGTFTPTSVTLTATANPSATFTYTPSATAGPRTVTLTATPSGGGMTTAHTATYSVTAALVAAPPTTDATRLALAWSAATGGSGTGYTYQVQRAPDSAGSAGTYATIGSSQSTTTYQDSGLTASAYYWYRVVATDSAAATATSTGVRLQAGGGAIGPTFLSLPIKRSR